MHRTDQHRCLADRPHCRGLALFLCDIYPTRLLLRLHVAAHPATARTAPRYLSVGGAVIFLRHAHTPSLAHPAAFVICKPAPGGGCVASPLELLVRCVSLTAKPRPFPRRAPWLVARFEMMPFRGAYFLMWLGATACERSPWTSGRF